MIKYFAEMICFENANFTSLWSSTTTLSTSNSKTVELSEIANSSGKISFSEYSFTICITIDADGLCSLISGIFQQREFFSKLISEFSISEMVFVAKDSLEKRISIPLRPLKNLPAFSLYSISQENWNPESQGELRS